ncbi:DUF1292 domain-containing protein [bacterium]|nr:DUF1292 domain-containing protein [bacterium]
MAEENDNIVETVDENGNKISFEVMDFVTVDDVEYALLIPTEHDCDCGCEDDEVIVMRIKREGEEYLFEEIEDDAEFEKVAAYIEQIEDEIDD